MDEQQQQQQQQHTSSLFDTRAANDFLAGFAGGATGVVAGQPLDTFRVRLQHAQGPDGGARRVWRGLVVQEGWRAMFKGMSYPLLASGLQNAITFHAYGAVSRSLAADSAAGSGTSLSTEFVAGSCAGLAQCALMVPIDVLKIRAQLSHAPAGQAHAGPAAQLATLLRAEGLTGLYRGTAITLIRDTPSYGVYFVTYAALAPTLDRLLRPHPPPLEAPQHLHPASQFLAGGAAGVTSWLSVYPFDVIKTRIQAQPRHQSPYRSWLHCAELSWRQEGGRVFWRGLTATLVRAFLVNASIFLGYETVLKMLQ